MTRAFYQENILLYCFLTLAGHDKQEGKHFSVSKRLESRIKVLKFPICLVYACTTRYPRNQPWKKWKYRKISKIRLFFFTPLLWKSQQHMKLSNYQFNTKLISTVLVALYPQWLLKKIIEESFVHSNLYLARNTKQKKSIVNHLILDEMFLFIQSILLDE